VRAERLGSVFGASIRGNEEGRVDAEEHDPEHIPAEKSGGAHAAPEGAGVHPLIDLKRDPNSGKADHAKPDEE
jgi:hypothetical protein